LLCPQNCHLKPGGVGVCRVRQRIGDKLYTLNYARVSSLGLDPIEKKPLYHFYPGSLIFSAGTIGCNLACGFCQNWRISQEDAPTRSVTSKELIKKAEAEKTAGNIGIAYTYSEPGMWFEYLLDTARLAREFGLKNVMVTNGYLRQEPLAELLPCLDAVNMDLKGMSDGFYKRACQGRLEPVLRFAEAVVKAGVHLEITNLLIPGWNDGDDDLRLLTDWVAGLNPDIPLHLSRYFPQYKFTAPETPAATMIKAYGITRERLNYVYLGNIGAEIGRDTICVSCGAVLIKRQGFQARLVDLAKNGLCRKCGQSVPVVMD